jgi:hypothetical protein
VASLALILRVAFVLSMFEWLSLVSVLNTLIHPNKLMKAVQVVVWEGKAAR